MTSWKRSTTTRGRWTHRPQQYRAVHAKCDRITTVEFGWSQPLSAPKPRVRFFFCDAIKRDSLPVTVSQSGGCHNSSPCPGHPVLTQQAALFKLRHGVKRLPERAAVAVLTGPFRFCVYEQLSRRSLTSELEMTRRSKARVGYIIAAGASFVFSVSLWFTGSKEQGAFVGLWVPSILSFGTLMLTGGSDE